MRYLGSPGIDVHINNVHGSQMAAKITGRFTIGEDTFRFTAIAFGRIGGQNVSAKVSRDVRKRLGELGHDPDDVIMQIQMDLLRGNMTLPEGLRKDSFVDD